MWKRLGYRLGRLALAALWACALAIASVIMAGTFAAAAFIAETGGFQRAAAIVAGSLILGIVVHEAGHAAAARLIGVRVAAIHIGGPPALVTIKLGSVPLGLGLRLRGRVVAAQWPPPGRAVLFTAAGPLANLLTAPVALALPAPRWLTWPVALIFAGMGAANLVPFRTRDGRASDGARLLTLPARSRAEQDLERLLASPDWLQQPEAVDRLLAGWRLQVPAALNRFHVIAALLRARDRFDVLLELHAHPFTLASVPAQEVVLAIHAMEWAVLTVPGLPQPAADLAAPRLEWVARHCGPEWRPAVQHTLALARLRQRRFAEVEPLCTPVLAAGLDTAERATVLATIAMARRGLGQDFRPPLDEALVLDPAAELVGEAAQAIGDPDSLGAAGSLPA